MQKNRFTTYLVYAVGEIVLVVIGILLAVQINNWNQDKQKRALEKNYLKEIKASLQTDIASAETLMAFNKQRLSDLDSILIKMQNRNYQEMIISLTPFVQRSFNYSIFKLNRIGFDNMVSSESISLISSDSLRQSLSEYYIDDGDWQERIELQSREYIDMMVPRLMSKPLFKQATGYDLPIADSYSLKVNEDPEALSLFLSLMQTTGGQNRLVARKKESAMRLIEFIEIEIEK